MTGAVPATSPGVFAAALLVAMLTTFAPASNAARAAEGVADTTDAIVDCYDSELDIVQRKLVGDCTGDVVTPERAERLRSDATERRRRMFANPGTPIISGRTLRSIGSGFFVATDGRMLTNNHVVEGCAAISVETPDGRKVEARVLDTEPRDDLALIATPLAPVATATFSARGTLPVGTPITVIGYPDQGLAPIKPLLTQGTLGEAGQFANGGPRFTIRADIRHGNSGGPVVDVHALVIGVVFAKVNSVAVFQMTGNTVRFLGVVIDKRAALDFLDRNKVPYRTAEIAPELNRDVLEARLRSIVGRVGCWT